MKKNGPVFLIILFVTLSCAVASNLNIFSEPETCSSPSTKGDEQCREKKN